MARVHQNEQMSRDYFRTLGQAVKGCSYVRSLCATCNRPFLIGEVWFDVERKRPYFIL
jgi:hypothetical protein